MSKKILVVASMCISVLLSRSGMAQTVPVSEFHFIAPGWTNPVNTIDMTQFWQPAGLTESGINTYLSGGPLSGASTWERFDPLSPRYQAWCGSYVVTGFQFASEWASTDVEVKDIPNSIGRVLELATIDQLAWLTGFEDPAPLAEVVPSSVRVQKGSGGFFFITAIMKSHSDVGSNVPFPFVPPPSPLVGFHDPVTLTTFLAFKYDARRGALLIGYSSGTIWTVGGVVHQTPFYVFAEEAEMLAHLRFE